MRGRMTLWTTYATMDLAGSVMLKCRRPRVVIRCLFELVPDVRVRLSSLCLALFSCLHLAHSPGCMLCAAARSRASCLRRTPSIPPFTSKPALFRASWASSRTITSLPRPIAMSIITEAPKPSSSQPEWRRPQARVEEPVLRVYNSLTRSKVSFVHAPLALKLTTRMYLRPRKADKSTGTIVVRQSTTHLTWDMLATI